MNADKEGHEQPSLPGAGSAKQQCAIRQQSVLALYRRTAVRKRIVPWRGRSSKIA